MKKDSLGDRMKLYEKSAEIHLLKRTPLIVRLDGKSFHTYCKGMKKPFDEVLSYCMVVACEKLAANMQGFKLAYTQSDEASFFMTDYDTLETDGWFGYDRSKIESVAASIFTAEFNRCMLIQVYTQAQRMADTMPVGDTVLILDRFKMANFDARAFSMPRDDVANYFLWRAKDWKRNSLSMYARSVFSHKELHGKNSKDIHEMLHKEGYNWAKHVKPQFRNGTYVFRDTLTKKFMSKTDVHDSHEQISETFIREYV